MRIDSVLQSENVFTGIDDNTKAASIAISNDRIVAVGSHEEIRTFVAQNNTGATPPIKDLGNALIVPGFHDSHVHFFHSAIYSSPLATTFLGENEADCVERMKDLAKRRPYGWLLAQGWREYRWNPPVLPTKRSLDEAFPNRPVALYSGDAHTLWLNSVALDELGVTRESVPPAGGSYDRDENGELTGIVREAAAMELMPRIMGSFTDEEVADAYRGFLSRLASQGITSVCDMSLMAHPGLDFIRDDIHASLLEKGDLTARIHMFPTLLADTSRFENMQCNYNHPLLCAPGFKQFFDGVSSQHTAWVTQPYTNAQFENDCGRPTVDPEVMRSYVMGAAKKGFPVRIHTIGDAAIHEALNIFEEARNTYGPLPEGKHHCLEHLENFLPEDIERLSKLDVVAAVQPPHMTLDPGGPESDLGPARVPYMWPFKTMLDANTVLAFGTDSPVVNVNSMDMLYSAVTRQDPATHAPQGGWLPNERVSMVDALRAYTKGSAISAGREHELGTIEPGMLADLTVVDQNLFTCNPEDIQKTRVVATFVGGRCVYEAEN